MSPAGVGSVKGTVFGACVLYNCVRMHVLVVCAHTGTSFVFRPSRSVCRFAMFALLVGLVVQAGVRGAQRNRHVGRPEAVLGCAACVWWLLCARARARVCVCVAPKPFAASVCAAAFPCKGLRVHCIRVAERVGAGPPAPGRSCCVPWPIAGNRATHGWQVCCAIATACWRATRRCVPRADGPITEGAPLGHHEVRMSNAGRHVHVSSRGSVFNGPACVSVVINGRLAASVSIVGGLKPGLLSGFV